MTFRFFLITGAALLVLAGGLNAAPLIYLDKVESTPDMSQKDGIGYLPENGKGYCAPVAVSNSFVWLAENGFPELVPSTGDRKMSQIRVAALLGESKYMQTDSKKGTGPSRVLKGVSRYIKEKKYSHQLKYQGWRKHPKEFDTGVSVPDMDWIKKELLGKSAVWLNVGWYNYDPLSASYSRIGGHWITLVGFGEDRDGNPNNNMLIIHDPAARTRRTKSTHRHILATKIQAPDPAQKPTLNMNTASYHERMSNSQSQDGDAEENGIGLPRSAEGFYKLTGQLYIQKKAAFAILDGVIVLKLNRPRFTWRK